jgi:hypothetical protein
MNGKTSREDSIELYHKENETSLLFPNLVHNDLDWEWKNKKPKECLYQGYFYEDKKLPHPLYLTHADFRRVKKV